MANGIDKKFGAFVKKFRKKRNLTQESLASQAGIDRSFHGRIERGEVSVSLTIAENIALAFGLKLCEFLSLAEQPSDLK